MCKGPLRLLGRKEHVFLESRLGCLEYRRRNLEKLGIGCYSERFIWINSILTKPHVVTSPFLDGETETIKQ